jgi:hypothetical protein
MVNESKSKQKIYHMHNPMYPMCATKPNCKKKKWRVNIRKHQTRGKSEWIWTHLLQRRINLSADIEATGSSPLKGGI